MSLNHPPNHPWPVEKIFNSIKFNLSIKLKEIKAANNHTDLVVDPAPIVPQRRLLSQLTP